MFLLHSSIIKLIGDIFSEGAISCTYLRKGSFKKNVFSEGTAVLRHDEINTRKIK